MSFVEGVLQESDVPLWRDLLRDRTLRVQYPTVEEIFWWLVDEYGERMGFPVAQRVDDKEPEPGDAVEG